jgi:hypothetical protein
MQSGTAAKGREITALDVAVADSWNDELAFRQGKFARRGLLEFRAKLLNMDLRSG